MKKILLSIVVALAAVMTAHAVGSEASRARPLVIYFSWGEFHKAEVDATTSASVVADGGTKYGTTERLAKLIAASTSADIWRIEPTEVYPAVYATAGEVVKDELDRGKVRTVNGAPDFAKYDTVFVGVPVWWHTAPTLVTNFLQEHRAELTGRTVIPFVTYWSTYGKETLAALVEATPTAKHKDGLATSKPSQREVDAWLRNIGEK